MIVNNHLQEEKAVWIKKEEEIVTSIGANIKLDKSRASVPL